MTYSEKLKSKKFHTLEALRVAISQQLERDFSVFHETKIMRCWDCVELLQKELKKIETQLKVK